MLDPSGPRGPLRLTIGRKLGTAFAVLAAILTLIGFVVVLEVHGMLTSVDRVLEEQRETGEARDLLRALHAFGDHVGLLEAAAPPPAAEGQVLRDLLAEIEGTLALLERGPGSHDPSAREHEGTEDRLYAALAGELAPLRRALEAGSPASALAPLLASAEHDASVLHEEMRGEASHASRELSRRGRRMRAVVIASSVAALVVLAVAFWTVRRTIVAPIRELEAGARRLGRGELGLRLPARTADEIGDLTRELNHMAGELEAMRTDLEARVRERTREFVRAARLAGLGTLAAGVAHEINNPLASIASCAEGLEQRLRGDRLERNETLEYLQIIAREAYRAHEITSRLLAFARAEPGTKEACDVPALAHELELFLRHRMQRTGVELELVCPDGVPPVLANASELKQVLLNLLENALDASPDGGRVRLECGVGTEGVELVVSDQGAGIDEGDLDRIFDPFFTTKGPGRGTGLGLAIVHRIVADHGGRVEVDGGGAGSGRGARFRVLLPVAREVPA